MTETNDESIRLNQLIEIISNMASLDFSKRLDVEITDDPLDVIAYGLNMLSEELEANMVRRSLLEETNANLERFAYTAAHDIRSPLSAAVSLVSFMESELNAHENAALREYCSLLKQIHIQAIGMVDEILKYSRTNYDDLKVNEIDLNKFCSEFIKRYSLQNNVVISFECQISLIRYNQVALEQIFSNLISNAIKYTDKKVCLIDIQCIDRETHYEISIKDNGPGIAQERIDNIFDLFENFKTEKEDSFGIGLSIVKKLVTQANGNIWVESVSGNGAKFIFTIKK